jgi:hypothetical protein
MQRTQRVDFMCVRKKQTVVIIDINVMFSLSAVAAVVVVVVVIIIVVVINVIPKFFFKNSLLAIRITLDSIS